MQNFVENVKPTEDKKVLLIPDGHTTHTKNLDAINYAKEHNVVLLSLPAHTSNKLQPLDVSFFKPLSCYFIDETEKWLRANPGRCVTAFQISMLFGKAYCRAASVGTAISGFEKSGIWPLNENAFDDYEFITISLGTTNNVQDEAVDPLELNEAITTQELKERSPISCAPPSSEHQEPESSNRVNLPNSYLRQIRTPLITRLW